MMTATLDPTGSRVEAIAATQMTADGYPDQIGIPTRMVSLNARPAPYRNVLTSRVVVVISIRMMTDVAGEGAGVNSGKYAR